MDLDQVLSVRPSRHEARPPWPNVQEGKLVLRNGKRYIRIDGDTSGALLGPALGGEDASAGDTVTFITPQNGVPVIVHPGNVTRARHVSTLGDGTAGDMVLLDGHVWIHNGEAWKRLAYA